MPYKIFLSVIWLCLFHPQAHTQQKLPDFELADLNHNLVTLSDVMGDKLTVIDFWATWCGNCKRAIPALKNLHKEFRNHGVEFIGVSIDNHRNLSQVSTMVKALKMSYPVLLDPSSELAGQLNIQAIPYLVIVNREREVVYTHLGYLQGDEDVLRTTIKQLTGEMH